MGIILFILYTNPTRKIPAPILQSTRLSLRERVTLTPSSRGGSLTYA